LNRSCEKRGGTACSQGRKEHPKYNKTKEGHVDWSHCVGTAFYNTFLREKYKGREDSEESVNS